MTSYVIGISANGCNPNGDPQANNAPRTDINGLGIISEYAIKHKIRLSALKDGKKCLVSNDGSKEDSIADYILEECVANGITEDMINDKKILEKQPDIRKRIYDIMNAAYFDFPLFGCTDSTVKLSKNQVFQFYNHKGACTLTEPTTRSPLIYETNQLTHSILSKRVENRDDVNTNGKESGEDSMGIYYKVRNALYIGSIDINHNSLTHNNGYDGIVNDLENYILDMFDYDNSTARPYGTIGVSHLIKFEYDTENKDKSISNKRLSEIMKLVIRDDGSIDNDLIGELSEKNKMTVTIVRNDYQ